ncbi:MFS transporter [Alloscardovia theropitheci]|uniref:MFS transporter n=1 Tax=Alloscardovia theropitheci TaxID=2496842 RepID=A0A4R0QVT9_9BIFI|nr:MFS transporter [Alloscardovia theropitheci]TCD54387.1 MFS transporter [Alloscardovia theropitheci]
MSITSSPTDSLSQQTAQRSLRGESNTQSTAIPPSPRKATSAILWLFAVGQLGWSILSGVISNWLVYFYQPSDVLISRGVPLFITQGAIVLGLTVIGLITASGRLIDAFLDPWIGAKSDASRHPRGRRMPFMRWAAIPFGLVTTLVFISPINSESVINNIVLFVLVVAFYFCMTCYCTPYNALIPELGSTQELRINVSTAISTTFFVGTAFAYLVPNIASLLPQNWGYVTNFRITIGILSIIAIVCMLVPTFTIDEKTYAHMEPSSSNVWESLGKTFKNHQFQIFIASDVLYWIGLTIFQTGMPFYITELMGFNDSMTFVFFAGMTVLSFLFYPAVNILAKKIGKKPLVSIAFIIFVIGFVLTSISGQFGIPRMVWALVMVTLSAAPLAILGILPQAVLADIAQADSIVTSEKREGMFYAARTFSMKLGQSLAMLLFTSISLIGSAGLGYRLTALVAAGLLLAGGIIFMTYNERGILKIIE